MAMATRVGKGCCMQRKEEVAIVAKGGGFT